MVDEWPLVMHQSHHHLASHASKPSMFAEHYSETASEQIMSGIWGLTTTRSSKRYYYYIFFMDDAKRFSNIKFLVDKKDAILQIKELINHKFGKYSKWM
jgi:hypothetical protein